MLSKNKILISLILLFSGTYIYSQNFTMDTVDIGTLKNNSKFQKFSEVDFRKSDMHSKLNMTVDLLAHKKKYIGKSIDDIYKTLGPSTGYFQSEYYPTYTIKAVDKTIPASWQIVFLITKDLKIKDIVVRAIRVD